MPLRHWRGRLGNQPGSSGLSSHGRKKILFIWALPGFTHQVEDDLSQKEHLLYLFVYLFNPHLSTCLLILERGEERERNINVREKHGSIASHRRPNRESNPKPRKVP